MILICKLKNGLSKIVTKSQITKLTWNLLIYISSLCSEFFMICHNLGHPNGHWTILLRLVSIQSTLMYVSLEPIYETGFKFWFLFWFQKIILIAIWKYLMKWKKCKSLLIQLHIFFALLFSSMLALTEYGHTMTKSQILWRPNTNPNPK